MPSSPHPLLACLSTRVLNGKKRSAFSVFNDCFGVFVLSREEPPKARQWRFRFAARACHQVPRVYARVHARVHALPHRSRHRSAYWNAMVQMPMRYAMNIFEVTSNAAVSHDARSATNTMPMTKGDRFHNPPRLRARASAIFFCLSLRESFLIFVSDSRCAFEADDAAARPNATLTIWSPATVM
eukprot:CAMPEP_0167821232 /NCGR_PEP_ID=MMETSP0112_2-20121227/6658_1 /TAXON_ID=91324 /ORGANISM="Lotharella globosa, Strain CCCM811" /LENGTH=183 /DNA_ID=CAMNT_0007722129 /DNA_START=330 /DNA_END=881 /DNA_ORIENTATION=+